MRLLITMLPAGSIAFCSSSASKAACWEAQADLIAQLAALRLTQITHLVQVGRGVVRRSGKDVALVGYGTAVNNCLAAAELLAANGISATVTDMWHVPPHPHPACLITSLFAACIQYN